MRFSMVCDAAAGAVEVHPATVGRVRRSFVEGGLEAAEAVSHDTIRRTVKQTTATRG